MCSLVNESSSYVETATSSDSSGSIPVTNVDLTTRRNTVATISEIHDIKKLHAVRLATLSPSNDNNLVPTFMPEYLVEWQDQQLESSWELASNIAEDALRDFEKSWWDLVRSADANRFKALERVGSLELLCSQRDKDGRTALHYIAGRGSIECAQILLKCQAYLFDDDSSVQSDDLINAVDKDGYSPLHLSAGYMHCDFVLYMLECGADPELKDKAGRNVIDLLSDLWRRMPASPENLDKRIKLQEISDKIDCVLFEEILPEKILDRREISNEINDEDTVDVSSSSSAKSRLEYLIQWPESDQGPTGTCSWEPAESLNSQLRCDYDNDIEYCDAVKLIDRRVKKINYKNRERTLTEYLVEWEDGAEASWEPLSHITGALVEAYEEGLIDSNEKVTFENELDEFEDQERKATEAKDSQKARKEKKMREKITY